MFVFFAIILFSPFCFAWANVEISEIMYDLKTGSDDGREWVEIFNNSDSAVDLSSFKFFEADTNHKILFVQGNVEIPSGGYAVIVSDPVKFKTDWPNFSGITASSGTPPSAVGIFDSTFSLNNSGENIAIKDGDTLLDEYFYKSSSGGAGDGKSLQKINGAWLASTPTPGRENIFVPPAPPAKPKTTITPKVSTTTPPSAPLLDQARLPDGQGGDEDDNNSYLFITILIFFLGLSAGAIYFVRRKGHNPQKGDDFELID